MNKGTVTAAIKSLHKRGLIEAKVKQCVRGSYRVRSIPELLNCALIPDSLKEPLRHRKQQLSEDEAQHLSESRAQKVTTSKVTTESNSLSLRDKIDDRIFVRVSGPAAAVAEDDDIPW
jgi:hypothetical protein